MYPKCSTKTEREKLFLLFGMLARIVRKVHSSALSTQYMYLDSKLIKWLTIAIVFEVIY